MASRTCWNVPQRQILVMASSMSLSVGFGFSRSSAATAMIMPLWQYPHCGTSLAIQACWTLWSAPLDAKPFDGGDILADGIAEEHAAGSRRNAVDMNRAGAALGYAAA